MTLSEMKKILDGGQISLTKSLGQNFLHDANQLRRIGAAAKLEFSDKVLEIGPGLGPLTELLIANSHLVLAIEKDARLARFTSERLKETPANTDEKRGKLEIVHDDALVYLRRNPQDWRGWKLVANLPYSVASPILVELALCDRGPDRMVATLQIEVARRLMATHEDRDYGVLTLLAQLQYAPEDWFKIPASCFFPEPEVDSACISLVRRDQQLLEPGLRALFVKLVKRGFSQRRKMMLKLLKQDWSVELLEGGYRYADIPSQARAEIVSLDQFVRLTQFLSAKLPRE